MFHQGPLAPDPGGATFTAAMPSGRLALLIDAENVPRDAVAAIVAAATRQGTADIRRAYGDWTGGALKGWGGTLHDHAIRPVQQFGLTAGKNAADIALVIDAMELLHTSQIDGFCIASSDADFTPLALHLRAHGRDVHGFGEAKTPRPFVTACTSFTFNDMPSKPDSAPADGAGPVPPDGATLLALLRAAVDGATSTGGWAPMSAAGTLARLSGVDPKAHGCKNLTELFVAMKLFDLRHAAPGQVMVRVRPRQEGASPPA